VDLPAGAGAYRDQVAALARRELGTRHQQAARRQMGHADHGLHGVGALVGHARQVVVRQQVVVGRAEMVGDGPQIGVSPRHIAFQAPVRLRAIDVDDAGDLGRVVVLLDPVREQESAHVDAGGRLRRAVELEWRAVLRGVVHGLRSPS
jgi:hypothetical protein